MSYIVTGGAGYLGSHLINLLISSDESEVIVVDDFSNGQISRLPSNIQVINSPLESKNLLGKVGALEGVKGVFHLAARKSVSESLSNPELYNRVNVEGTANVIELCKYLGVQNLVFTSSAAVYGNGRSDVAISESNKCSPESPYGYTKLMAEELVNLFGENRNISTLNLRVFNMAGTEKSNYFDPNGENVIPIILRSIAEGKPFRIFGNNLLTSDGTCVRDYIHVNDVARAHLMAMQKMEEGMLDCPKTMNISSGQGTSVLQLIQNLEVIASRKIPIEFHDLRQGDSESVIGDCRLANTILGWTHEKDIKEMLFESWQAWNSL